jgi:hypothetical protein
MRFILMTNVIERDRHFHSRSSPQSSVGPAYNLPLSPRTNPTLDPRDPHVPLFLSHRTKSKGPLVPTVAIVALLLRSE